MWKVTAYCGRLENHQNHQENRHFSAERESSDHAIVVPVLGSAAFPLSLHFTMVPAILGPGYCRQLSEMHLKAANTFRLAQLACRIGTDRSFHDPSTRLVRGSAQWTFADPINDITRDRRA